MAGYPGTIAATWQRAGRAGRRASRSAAVMVASSAPIDQFVVRHPSYFFDASPERALIDPDNLHILVDHIKCAAFELPFTAARSRARSDPGARRAALQRDPAASCARAGAACTASGGAARRADAVTPWTWTSESYPADAVSLRSVSSDNFVVVDTTGEPRVIGETDFTSGPSTLHPKAIYIVEGQLYPGGEARLRGAQGLRPRDRLRLLHRRDHLHPGDGSRHVRDGAEPLRGADAPTGRVPGAVRSHGEVHVVSRVVGFKKIKFYTNENVGSGELDLPEQQMHTTAYWLTVPAPVMGLLPYAADDRRDGIVGLAFAMRQVAQLLLMCDRHDIGISIDTGAEGWRRARRRRRQSASSSTTTIRAASASASRSSACTTSSSPRTRQLIAECACENGCPTCVGPGGEHRTAREGGGAAHPRSAASPGGWPPDHDGVLEARRSAARHPAPGGAGRRGGAARRPGRLPARPSRTRSAAQWRGRRRAPVSSSSAGSSPTPRTAASGSAIWRPGSSARPASAAAWPAARPRARRSCSSISRRPA